MKFDATILDGIKWYVYRLIDPRTKETFYVGKGSGQRMFDHVSGSGKVEDDTDEDGPLMSNEAKMAVIGEIHDAGLEVEYIIHRHGIKSSSEAYQIEAAVFDCYPHLTNIAGGHGSGKHGAQTLAEISERYSKEEVVFGDYKLIVIDIGKTFGRKHQSRQDVYDAVRLMWSLDKARAERCEYVIAHRQDVILGVFRPDEWLVVNEENFPEPHLQESIRRMLSKGSKKLGFRGHRVDDPEIVSRFEGKRLPTGFRTSPQASCRYVNLPKRIAAEA